MKVVAISNFNNPEISDALICETATEANARKQHHHDFIAFSTNIYIMERVND